MRDDDFILIRSVSSACGLLLLSIAFLHLAGVPFWLPLNGTQRFNPVVEQWLLASIPVGAFIGCALGVREKTDVMWRVYLSSWLCGSVAGLICFGCTIGYLSSSSPLPVCVVGIALCALVFFITLWRAHRKPMRIPRRW